jgi:CRP/FNR family transcriptional regulator, nitrogen oxide reductase regulator
LTLLSTAADTRPSKSKFLAGLSEHDQGLILRVAERRSAPAKEVIIHGGERAAFLFLLLEGRAKYYHVTAEGEELLLFWLTPGDVFGLGTLLKSPPAYLGTAETLKDCDLLVWEHSVIRGLSGVYPQLAENALRITLGYLAAYADRHSGIATRTAEQRLAETLLRLGHRAGRTHPNGVDIDITNEQLGGLADVGAFTASRLLSKWARQGTIAKERGWIRIHAPENLLTE